MFSLAASLSGFAGALFAILLWELSVRCIALAQFPRRRGGTLTLYRMLAGPFEALLANRVLVARLVSRDIRVRYQGSMLGVCWALAVPLISFAAYWFVLGIVLQVRWGGTQDASFPLMLFSGLVVYWFAAEVIGHAPR